MAAPMTPEAKAAYIANIQKMFDEHRLPADKVKVFKEGLRRGDFHITAGGERQLNQIPDDTPDSLTIKNSARALLRGIPIVGAGLDELGAGFKALNGIGNGKSLGENYDAELEAIRAENEKFDTENPGTSMGLQFLGGTAATLPFAATAAGAKILGLGGSGWGAAGRSLLSGMGLGAGHGFLSGEDGLSPRVGEATKQAAFGGLVGGALPAIASGATAVIRKAKPIVEGAADLFGLGSKVAKPVPLPKMPKDVKRVYQAFKRNPVTVADIQNGARLFNMNPGFRHQAKIIASKGGAGHATITQAVDNQAANAGNRINQTLRDNIGPNVNLVDRNNQILDARDRASWPAFETAFGAPVIVTDQMRRLAANPSVARGMKEGIAIERNRLDAAGRDFDPAAYDIVGADAEGNPILGDLKSLRPLHTAIEGLDELIRKDLVRSNTGRLTPIGESYQALKKSLLSEMDKAKFVETGKKTPYAAARKADAGPTADKSALDAGANVWKKSLSPDEMEAEMKGMSDSERQEYINGARGELARTIGNSNIGEGEAIKFFGDKPWTHQKLTLLVGPDEADRLLTQLAAERDFATQGGNLKKGIEAGEEAMASKDIGYVPIFSEDANSQNTTKVHPLARAASPNEWLKWGIHAQRGGNWARRKIADQATMRHGANMAPILSEGGPDLEARIQAFMAQRARDDMSDAERAALEAKVRLYLTSGAQSGVRAAQ